MIPLWMPTGIEPRLTTIAGIVRGGVMGNPLHAPVYEKTVKRWIARTELAPLMENPAGVQWWDVGLILQTLMQDEQAQQRFKVDPDFLALAAEHITLWPEAWTPATVPLPWSLSQEMGFSHEELTWLVTSATIRGELPNYGLAVSSGAAAWCMEQIRTVLTKRGKKGEDR